MDATAEADRMSMRLRDLAPERVDASPIIRTSLPFYGAKVGDLRKAAAIWHREHPEASPEEMGAVADALWDRAIREEMVVAAFILGRSRNSRSAMSSERLLRWTPSLDNWETTDQLGMAVVGPWVDDGGRDRFAVLEDLATSAHPWSRRLSLVAASRLSRSDHAVLWWPPSADLVLLLANDREAAIPKAISWVLREHTRRSAAEVEAFIDDHAGQLPAVAIREARKKLETGRKSG